MNLTHKRILLIAPKYFDYEKVLINAMTEAGATVHYIENKAFKYDPLNRGTGLLPSLLCRKKKYSSSIHHNISTKTYDVCLFINLFSFHPKIIKTLKKNNTSIQCILYLWDNIKGYKWGQFFNYFDKVYSFDPLEARSYGLHYLPNFFPAFDQLDTQQEAQYDFCFIGSFQIQRLRILEELALSFQRAKKSFFFYLHLSSQYNKLKYNRLNYFIASLFPERFSGFRNLYELITGKTTNNIVHSSVLPLDKTIRILSSTSTLLDLPYPEQSGSTQRLTLGLGLRKKIITTNQSVVHDSFYSEESIRIISREKLSIDYEWIDTPVSSTSIEDLKINNWIKTLLADVK